MTITSSSSRLSHLGLILFSSSAFNLSYILTGFNLVTCQRIIKTCISFRLRFMSECQTAKKLRMINDLPSLFITLSGKKPVRETPKVDKGSKSWKSYTKTKLCSFLCRRPQTMDSK